MFRSAPLMKTLPRLLAASSAAAACALLIAGLDAQTPSPSARPAPEALRLGTVHFPTSGAPAAQPHFLHGIAALHSFWYEEALEAFARALEIDPAFTMARWGEAMCYYRSFRPGTDHKAGKAVLEKIQESPTLTKRERAYLGALRALYGKGGSFDSKAFAAAMEEVHRDHPDDDEAAAFYSLALLGNRSGGAGAANLEKAGQLAQEVYGRNPNHPGAAHYIIHSYDSPAQANRALDAAFHYSKIAPDAPHALHMPSHIFLQLGMWHEAANSNDLGWAASVDYVKRKGLTPTLRDYHNLHWLIYASLQQGRHAKAAALVDEFVRMRGANELASYSARYINSAIAAYVIETRRWDRAAALFAAAPTATPANSRAAPDICGAEPSATPPPSTRPTTKTGGPSLSDTAEFIRAYAVAARGEKSDTKGSDIRALQIDGLAKAQAKNFRAAIATLREAAAAEARTAKPPGPPSFKPSHELLGEVLLQAGRPREALAEFKIALDRHPGRTLALLGRARAESASGDKTAARVTYTQLLEIWKDADADLPELGEARDFVKAGG